MTVADAMRFSRVMSEGWSNVGVYALITVGILVCIQTGIRSSWSERDMMLRNIGLHEKIVSALKVVGDDYP